MKRFRLNGISFLIILLVLCPMMVQAITLKEYEDQVAKYTAELNDKKNQIAKTSIDV